VTNFWRSLEDRILGWWVCIFGPPATIDRRQANKIGICVEVVESPPADYERPAVFGTAGNFVGGICTTEHPIFDECDDGSAPRIKILSKGLPLYIATQRRLLIVGELVEPLAVRVIGESTVHPYFSEFDDEADDLRERDNARNPKDGANDGPVRTESEPVDSDASSDQQDSRHDSSRKREKRL